MPKVEKDDNGLASALIGSLTDDFKPRPELLLHPNVPKPLHGLAPRVVLGQKWWDAERFAANRKTGNRCAACGVFARSAPVRPFLEGHEIYEIDYPEGTATYVETAALCHCCHAFIHDGRLQILLDAGTITRGHYDFILERGRGILRRAGLRKTPYVGEIAEWSRWRLVVGGKEYPTPYRDYDAWVEFHRKKFGGSDAES